MTFIIKPEYKYSYPSQVHDWNFRYVAAEIHPQLYHWVVLLLGQDGELYSMRRDHVKLITPLEILL